MTALNRIFKSVPKASGRVQSGLLGRQGSY